MQTHPPDRPLSWYQGFYLSLSELKIQLHINYEALKEILDKEEIPVTEIQAGRKLYRYISPEHLPRLRAVYASKTARERRQRNWKTPRKPPLKFACPHCHKRGRQWRAGTLRSGSRQFKCGHCNRCYSHQPDRRPPLHTTCPHCGATTKQYRNRVLPSGKMHVRCAHCRHYHSIPNPDSGPQSSRSGPRRPPLQSTCPRCAATSKQWRAGARRDGTPYVLCALCRKFYTIPNPQLPKEDPLPESNPNQPIAWTPIFERIDW